MKKKLIPVVVLILAVVGYLIWMRMDAAQHERMITGSGTIETTEIPVGSRVGGRITMVQADEGQAVKSGQALVVLDPYQLPAQRQQLEAQLAQAQARLNLLINGPRPQEVQAARAQYEAAQAQANLAQAGARQEDIAQAQANVRQAEADLQNTTRNFERFEALYNRKVVSQQELDNARTADQVAQERVNVARQQLRELQAGNRPQEVAAAQEQARAQLAQYRLIQSGTRQEEIAAQQAVVSSIQAQLAQLGESITELKVYSPCDCQVSSLDLKPGQLIAPNQTLATLTDLDALWVRVYIPEERFGQVQTGDVAEVRVDAFPRRVFKGKVVQLATRAEFTPRNVQTQETRRMQVFGVKVALDNKSRLLRPGMPADITFPHPKQAH